MSNLPTPSKPPNDDDESLFGWQTRALCKLAGPGVLQYLYLYRLASSVWSSWTTNREPNLQFFPLLRDACPVEA